MRILKRAARPPNEKTGRWALGIAVGLAAFIFASVQAEAADPHDFGNAIETMPNSQFELMPVYGFIHVTPDGEKHPVLMLRLDTDIQALAWFLGVRMPATALEGFIMARREPKAKKGPECPNCGNKLAVLMGTEGTGPVALEVWLARPVTALEGFIARCTEKASATPPEEAQLAYLHVAPPGGELIILG